MIYVALRMLTGDKSKFLGILLGISFASLIITQQPGIFIGLMTRTFSFISDVGIADIWVMDPKTQVLDDTKAMPSTMVYRVGSITGVEWAKPLYKGQIQARLKNGNFQACNVIGIDDATMVGGPPIMLEGKLEDLRQTDAIIINQEGALDKLAHPPLYKGGPKIPMKIGDVLEINDRRAKVVGIAKTTSPFQSQPIVFTTYSRALSYAPSQRDLLTFILVKRKEGVDLDQLKEQIKTSTKMGAYTKEEFQWMTVKYYIKRTGIAINFGFSVFMGFLVGTIIAAQTFYNFTIENEKYFAVLKALGAKNFTLLKMILFQAGLVGFLGYGLGLGATFLFWLSLGRTGLIVFKFHWQLLLSSFFGVLIIIGFSALLSIQRVIRLDPMMVFRK